MRRSPYSLLVDDSVLAQVHAERPEIVSLTSPLRFEIVVAEAARAFAEIEILDAGTANGGVIGLPEQAGRGSG